MGTFSMINVLAKCKRLIFALCSSPGMIGRLGDIISDSSVDAIQAFERNNNARLCKEAIHSGFVDSDEIPLYFNHKVRQYE